MRHCQLLFQQWRHRRRRHRARLLHGAAGHGAVLLPDEQPQRGPDARAAHHPGRAVRRSLRCGRGDVHGGARGDGADLSAGAGGAGRCGSAGYAGVAGGGGGQRTAFLLPVHPVRHGHRLAAGYPGDLCGRQLPVRRLLPAVFRHHPDLLLGLRGLRLARLAGLADPHCPPALAGHGQQGGAVRP